MGGWVAIKTGLDEGETVITEGIIKVRPIPGDHCGDAEMIH